VDGSFLTHDTAWDMAREIVEIFAGCLREAERHDAFVEAYTRLKARLEEFQERTSRMHHRMRPGLN
jgi:hypothetical protein